MSPEAELSPFQTEAIGQGSVGSMSGPEVGSGVAVAGAVGLAVTSGEAVTVGVSVAPGGVSVRPGVALGSGVSLGSGVELGGTSVGVGDGSNGGTSVAGIGFEVVAFRAHEPLYWGTSNSSIRLKEP